MTNSSPWKDPPMLLRTVNHLFLWTMASMAILLWWGLMIKDGILGIHNTETLWPDEFTIHILHTHKIMCLIFGVLCIKKIYHHITMTWSYIYIETVTNFECSSSACNCCSVIQIDYWLYRATSPATAFFYMLQTPGWAGGNGTPLAARKSPESGQIIMFH